MSPRPDAIDRQPLPRRVPDGSRRGHAAAAARGWRAGVVLVGALLLAGCQALPPVQPWERGYLAQPAMKLDGAKLEGSFADHVYTSKEAGLPGRGVGAGGCGCN